MYVIWGKDSTVFLPSRFIHVLSKSLDFEAILHPSTTSTVHELHVEQYRKAFNSTTITRAASDLTALGYLMLSNKCNHSRHIYRSVKCNVYSVKPCNAKTLTSEGFAIISSRPLLPHLANPTGTVAHSQCPNPLSHHKTLKSKLSSRT